MTVQMPFPLLTVSACLPAPVCLLGGGVDRRALGQVDGSARAPEAQRRRVHGGHRFLASRIATIRSASGLRIGVGSIEGSIYRNAVLRDLTLSDPKGRFLHAPRVELDWWPFAWASNRLDIDRLVIPQATLYKLPKLNPTQRRGPILPGFDIRLMQFSVGRLDLAPAVTGRAQTATLSGDADIRGGRAIIDLSARTLDGVDRCNGVPHLLDARIHRKTVYVDDPKVGPTTSRCRDATNRRARSRNLDHQYQSRANP